MIIMITIIPVDAERIMITPAIGTRDVIVTAEKSVVTDVMMTEEKTGARKDVKKEERTGTLKKGEGMTTMTVPV